MELGSQGLEELLELLVHEEVEVALEHLGYLECQVSQVHQERVELLDYPGPSETLVVVV